MLCARCLPVRSVVKKGAGHLQVQRRWVNLGCACPRKGAFVHTRIAQQPVHLQPHGLCQRHKHERARTARTLRRPASCANLPKMAGAVSDHIRPACGKERGLCFLLTPLYSDRCCERWLCTEQLFAASIKLAVGQLIFKRASERRPSYVTASLTASKVNVGG